MESKPQYISEYALDFTEDSAAFVHYQALLAPRFKLEATDNKPFNGQSKVYLLADLIFSVFSAQTESPLSCHEMKQ